MGEVRTVAVMGATGKQGRGVIDALRFGIGSVQYDIRPMTRSLNSEVSREFTRDYPQLSLVKWQEEDVETLRRCFEGCYGAFITTSAPSEGQSVKEQSRAEIELGKRCLTAAKAANIRHLIYPTFPSIFNASNGRINIRRFETKHQIALEIQSSSIPSTILCPGPFYTDFQDSQYSYWDGDKVIFSTPAAPFNKMGFADPGYDIGWFARASLDNGPEFLQGQEVPVCGQSISYSDLALRFTAVRGIKAEYRQCTPEEFERRYEELGGPERQDMAALGRWLAIAPSDRACYGTIDMKRLMVAETKMRVKALSWEAFLERTRWSGPMRGN